MSSVSNPAEGVSEVEADRQKGIQGAARVYGEWLSSLASPTQKQSGEVAA